MDHGSYVLKHFLPKILFLLTFSLFFIASLTAFTVTTLDKQPVHTTYQNLQKCPGSTRPTSQSLLIVLLDRSLSLSGTDPDEYSTSVAKILVDFWPGRMAVIPFSGTGRLSPLGPVNLTNSQNTSTQNRDWLTNQIEMRRNELGGYTPLERAMQDALKILEDNNFPKGSEVILITDGAPSIPGDIHGVQEAKDIQQTLVSQFCQEGVPINAFGLKIDRTTEDGLRAYNLLNYIADNTQPVDSNSPQYYSVTDPSGMATPIIQLIARWRGLKLIPASQQGTLSSVNVDTYANQVYIITFHSKNAILPLLGSDSDPVPDGAFVERLQDMHYDYYNLSGKRFSSKGKYSVDKSTDSTAAVYALEDTRLRVEPISPVSGSNVTAGQSVTISAAFVDENNPNNYVTLQAGSGTIVATYSLMALNKTVFQGTETLVQEKYPHNDIYTAQITLPQAGTLYIKYSGVVEDVTIPQEPDVKVGVNCAIGDISCYWQENPLLVILPAIILIVAILILFWLLLPRPCGTLKCEAHKGREQISLGTARSLPKILFSKSTISYNELSTHPDGRACFRFRAGTDFNLRFKWGCKARLVPTRGNSSDIVIKYPDGSAKKSPGELVSGSTVQINGVDKFSFYN